MTCSRDVPWLIGRCAFGSAPKLGHLDGSSRRVMWSDPDSVLKIEIDASSQLGEKNDPLSENSNHLVVLSRTARLDQLGLQLAKTPDIPEIKPEPVDWPFVSRPVCVSHGSARLWSCS